MSAVQGFMRAAIGMWLLSACMAIHAAAPKAETVTLVVVGDIMLEDGPGRAMRRGQDPFAGFATLFKEADIRVGNRNRKLLTRK